MQAASRARQELEMSLYRMTRKVAELGRRCALIRSKSPCGKCRLLLTPQLEAATSRHSPSRKLRGGRPPHPPSTR